MKPFHEWMRQSIPEPETVTKRDIPEELSGYEDPDAEGGYRYPCRVCGQDTDILCEPEEFIPENHYCGGSPRCCP